MLVFNKFLLDNSLPTPGTIIHTPKDDQVLVLKSYNITVNGVDVIISVKDTNQDIHWDLDLLKMCTWDTGNLTKKIRCDSVYFKDDLSCDIFKYNERDCYYAQINYYGRTLIIRSDREPDERSENLFISIRNSRSPLFWAKFVNLLRKYGFEKYII